MCASVCKLRVTVSAFAGVQSARRLTRSVCELLCRAEATLNCTAGRACHPSVRDTDTWSQLVSQQRRQAGTHSVSCAVPAPRRGTSLARTTTPSISAAVLSDTTTRWLANLTQFGSVASTMVSAAALLRLTALHVAATDAPRVVSPRLCALRAEGFLRRCHRHQRVCGVVVAHCGSVFRVRATAA